MATTPVRAQRRRAPLKLALMGPSGSGKTWSALLIAQGIGPRILVIDTENHSSELYDHLCPFDTVPIEEPYSVLKLIDELKAHAKNYDVIIIDTMSKFWNGKGGLLEMQEVEARRSGNKWTAWAPVTELYNDLVEELINSKVHVIGTFRAKTQWVVEADSNNKTRPVKVGTSPIMRDGIEYEFTTMFTLDQQHYASVTKDRTSIFDKQVFVPSIETGRRFMEWHNAAPVAPLAPAPVPVTNDPGDLRAQTGAAPASPPPSPPPSGPNQLPW
jgi:hypothetical protein